MNFAATLPANRRGQVVGRSRTIGLAAALTIAASMSIAGLVSAAPLEYGEFHHEFSNVVTDFCGVPGLTVQVDGVVDGRSLVNPHGPDGLIYFLEHVHVSRVLTNPANGKTISDDTRGGSKDLDVIDNGDGTLTVTVLATGNFTLYGSDGNVIARDPGQVRLELLIDHGGTVTDPFDDVELSGFEIRSTGRSDDFCEAAVAALT